jgi:hypothetical protein
MRNKEVGYFLLRNMALCVTKETKECSLKARKISINEKQKGHPTKDRLVI